MYILAQNFWHLEHDILVSNFAARKEFTSFHPLFRVNFDPVQLHKLLVQALTAPGVSKTRYGNYDKLEFLGDAILKYVTVLTLSTNNLAAKVKSLCAKKNDIVSNSNLFNLSQVCDIPSLLQTENSPWLSCGFPGTCAIQSRCV